ncbi:hypothetical protein B0J13DRAFT_323320 [Dactylonectria estremocensis]|uniref:Azaphilone pigments biosynthesis cluster protein L N-terminal domain-containing protein n=1 Tax=Dactylonectria estremocensis TaxID=1079267 RepID=A0A9P9J1Q6_9HYPO|nr:hypothetical protein B0J13DRAFT_323320 [Dactylonectria estremocensis]
MAEALGVASALIAIVTAAVQASSMLYNTVQSFKTHQTTVRQLMSELRALAKVLDSLKDHVGTEDGTFVPLKFPLIQCTRACREMRELIEKRSRRSGGSRTSFRDWASLSYMKSNLTDFTNMLAGYKSTINIALADANLRNAKVTLDMLNEYKGMIQDTKYDLEQHLSDINHKLQSFVPSSQEHAATLVVDVERMSNERDGIERCVTICSNFLEQINAVQFQLIPTQIAPSENPSVATPIARPTLAATMTFSTVKCCKTMVTDHISLLQDLRKNTEASLQLESTTTSRDMGVDAERDLERLRSEVDSTKQRLAFFDDAFSWASSGKVHIVEDITVGDNSSQVCTSTDDLIWVKRARAGHGSLQVFGSMPPDVLMDILRGQNERQFIQDRENSAGNDSANSAALAPELFSSTSTSTRGGGTS